MQQQLPRQLGRVVVVLGATGTGKSQLAIELAHRFNGEVVSTDSMQLYEGLDTVTNKVTAEEAGGIPHHMMSYLSPLDIGYTVGQFRQRALWIIDDVIARNKLPVLVGGTGYYIESLLWNTILDDSEDVAASTSTNLTFYNSIPENLHAMSGRELHEELKKVDPDMADRLHPNDLRRLVRALQVYYQTGRPQSDHWADKAARSGSQYGGTLRWPGRTLCLWIRCEREVHRKRLSERVEAMSKAGLKKELTDFYDKYYGVYQEKLEEYFESCGDRTRFKGIFQSIGLKEFLPFLSLSPEERDSAKGAETFDECTKLLVQATVSYARVQEKRIKAFFIRKPERQLPWLYELDSTDLSTWSSQVFAKSVDIVDAFLKDVPVPYDPIPAEPDPYGGAARRLHHCQLCNVTVMNAAQFEVHLKSKGHRANVRKSKMEGVRVPSE